MKLKQLHYFIAVAEELHFGRAAERLDMAQPPLSRQIKQLEEDLGAVLFNRGRTSISLTQAGERLYERASSIAQDIEDTRQEIKRLGQGAEGRLRIGFVGSATYGILPNIIQEFRATYPNVFVSLLPMNNAQLNKTLIRREIDVAFARPALGDAEFITRKLAEEDLILALPAATSDALDTKPDESVDLQALTDQNIILYPEYPRPSYADFILNAFADIGIDVAHRVFTMDLQTALSLVAIGEGVCVVPASVGQSKRQGIDFRTIAQEVKTTEISINYRVDEQSVQVHNFIKLAQMVAMRLA